MQDFEKLGAFYLGRVWDAGKGAPTEDLLLYDSKDLTTHAVCVGMTGSGKTGLCIALLEEAAIDGIPAIVIDPKGDLGNLLLTFPDLRPSDFRPWIDEAEAARKGVSPDDLARTTAEGWKKGLADWGESGERIARLRAAADFAIYTPGSSAGTPLSVLRSFAAPAREIVDDSDALRERVTTAVSGLLALMKIDADPIQSREHILLSNILDRAWREGNDLDLAGLIHAIQQPPFDTIGVMGIESFFPAKERMALSLALNGLVASPGFSAWMEGEPLDVGRLLFTAEGKPRVSILSIAHLGDAERMFFLTVLLNEVVGWMRAQPGTSSLRALLYMDEVFGFFPPTANPPSKTPMLTLLKQARAYGVGVVLATQNPVDLDYKGLSNAGTWLIGRLQTERDKLRVLDGLEGASTAAGMKFDRQQMEATLGGLGSRVFLMNNVHEDHPVLFQSRQALCYLRGPLTKAQIRTLGSQRGASAGPKTAAAAVVAAPAASSSGSAGSRPVLPPESEEAFLRGSSPEPIYRPALLGTGRIHFASTKAGVDIWQEVALLAPLDEAGADDPWEHASAIDPASIQLGRDPDPRGKFAALPAAAGRPKSYPGWSSGFAETLYRTRTLALFSCAALKAMSKAGESEGDFRARLALALREQRDAGVEAVRKRYAPKIAALQDRIAKAEARVTREQTQYQQQNVQTAISFGASVLGALLGRKVASAANLGRAASAMRGVGRSVREKEDVGAAQESAETLRGSLADLNREVEAEAAKLQGAPDAAGVALDPVEIRPKKSDVSVTKVRLVWVP